MNRDFILEIRNLSVGYGRRVVLSDVTLSLPRGSFTGLLGPNGSGKSTLLKATLGIIPPLSGKILFHPADASLGYVPQAETFDPLFLLSAREVVLMGACRRIAPGRQINRTERDFAMECLRQTGVEDAARKRFSELSGGQKQRVLIARALATRPDFMVLDEPTASVDAPGAYAIMELIKGIHEKSGLSILMVNHDLAILRQYVQDVIWLNDGRVAYGPASEFLTREKIEQTLGLHLF